MNSSLSLEVRGNPRDASARPGDVLLEVRDVALRFGGIIALDGVSFDLEKGQILGLIGPNGAGKTTLFNCLSRLYTPDRGDIRFRGESILAEPAHRIATLGIARTFQNLALFRRMSVLDNIRVGGHTVSRSDYLSDALHLPWSRREEKALEEAAAELIDYLGLRSVAQWLVADLSIGTQKRVELARALMVRPQLILLDEPASGFAHRGGVERGPVTRQNRAERGVPVLLVERHMSLVMSISDKVVALDFGRKIAEGSPEAVKNNP